MSFGQTLKQLLSISGIKSSQLSDLLGYDNSYISRWINDIKLPSLKNNGDLFDKISNILVSGCDERAAAKLCSFCAAETDSELRGKISVLLREAYESHGECDSLTDYTSNACLLSPKQMISQYDMYIDAISRAAQENRDRPIDCITDTPLSRHGNRDNMFWAKISACHGQNKTQQIMVHQIINMCDFSQNIDKYCATICSFTGRTDSIHYEFYNDASQTSAGPAHFFAVEDYLLSHVIPIGLTNDDTVIVCTDKSLLAPRFLSMKRGISKYEKLLVYCDVKTQLSGQFLYDYIMDGYLRYFLCTMQPIYMSSELSHEILRTYAPGIKEDAFSVLYDSKCANINKEVIVYRSEILEYIYSGRILLYGSHIKLSREHRIEHLKQLLSNIEQGFCKLSILNDTNPLLSRDEMNSCIYLSKHTGFAISYEGKAKDRGIRFTSHKTVINFNKFFEHFYTLGSEYITTDAEAEDFVRRCIQLL